MHCFVNMFQSYCHLSVWWYLNQCLHRYFFGENFSKPTYFPYIGDFAVRNNSRYIIFFKYASLNFDYILHNFLIFANLQACTFITSCMIHLFFEICKPACLLHPARLLDRPEYLKVEAFSIHAVPSYKERCKILTSCVL